MSKKFMVFWQPLQKPDERYLSLVPEEVKAAQALRESGKIIGDWIASDRSKGWLLMKAESEAEVVNDLKTLPLYDFLGIEITGLFNE